MNPSPMPAPMLEDVARQPDVLTSMIERSGEFRRAGKALAVESACPLRRILVTGCGDGLFAAQAASAHAAGLGLDWRAVGPMELLVGADTLHESDRVVAISMSGNVDRTVEAATLVQARGIPLLALVNGDGGKLGKLAGTKVSLDLADVAGFLCGTASYTATSAALLSIADGIADAASPALSDGLVEAQRTVLAASEAVLPAVTGMPFTGVRLLSAGADTGTAAYGAAKLVELTRLPSWSADLEEFAHSQYWSMPATDLVVVIAAHPVLAGYAAESCRALSVLGVTTLAIDTAASPVETATHRITLPPIHPALAPLVTALPLQLLAYRLAEASGLNPNTRRHLKDVETRFRVSRLLTRRSLLGTGL
ncbi:glucosamine 6-phosphate synthetase-like amidotransferase/phosphosugar isomerase protein [Skermanella aerolata]|uniref:SIS domain-containing protein n=1 Tax=Skermanella aerolata TaxID=393310 RepID=UPI003D1C1436